MARIGRARPDLRTQGQRLQGPGVPALSAGGDEPVVAGVLLEAALAGRLLTDVGAVGPNPTGLQPR
jgi:hypothetical protein